MKKFSIVLVGLLVVALDWQSMAQIATDETRAIQSPTEEPGGLPPLETTPGTVNDILIFQRQPEDFSLVSAPSERSLADMPFDAFLADSGYIVYPVEENCATLHFKVEKNPMILHKDFIPRRVHVLRRVDGRSSDGSVKGVLGKQFMIVSEIGSTTQFMVDLKDLHFVQDLNQALGSPN